ncbi:Bug family tripartite tricarboxylate transporter substrate binding protein [Ramlibacter tataouinensis]|uniref:Candidate extracytoplasmic binding receptor n=1 Tax=Ramlibacter tataouinensis (strain ATCC BAA-407 / DSM 14655 / LMG 21543 / TTB310) TaxID=365046 RepID=F5XWR2_RAMTT|nr:tripartite tricarboxylate transporter substrate binding protein [Ramlibacter tataouinensis]AEG94206.1 Candidate extracytoplasmic binding receptor [Ramlibacter tataouinensis TTB310]
MQRRLVATALALCAACAPALAQDAWPARPVRFVVNFPAGGPLDLLARAVGDTLQRELKQPFVVENRPGAAGNIGADAVAKAAADGHTVLFTIDSTSTVNPHIYQGMPFKPADLQPLVIMGSSGLLVGVHPSNGFKTLADLVAAGKTRGVTFSSAGNGSPGHLAAEMATQATGIRITHVPYKGNAPAVQAVLSGEVTGGVLATPGMLPHVKAGKMTALAVTSSRRSTLAPEVPTVREAGMPQLEQEVLYLAMVPAATPAPVAQAIQNAIEGALARQEIRSRLGSLDMHHEGTAGTAAARRLANLSERYGQVIRATGMKVE